MPKKTSKKTAPVEDVPEEIVDEKPKKGKINVALIRKEVTKRQKSMHPAHVQQALDEVLEEMGLSAQEWNEAVSNE